MAMTKTPELDQIIQFTPNGVIIATFVQIRAALVNKFRDIYGNDIDLSDATADGQFINAVALVFSNIANTIDYAYKSINPAEATGKYLDILCAFSNIKRIPAAKSTAVLYVKNITNQVQTPASIIFQDKNRNNWTWENPQGLTGYEISWKPGEVQIITDVICDEYGPIVAGGSKIDPNTTPEGMEGEDDTYWDLVKDEFDGQNGDIYETIDFGTFKVWQRDDCVVGRYEENDEQLRRRRVRLLGNSSVSILEGLQGSLLNVTGIKDCFIYNNFENEDVNGILGDAVVIPSHSIYIALRYEENANISDATIGRLIYSKLTPGCGTTDASASESGTNQLYNYEINTILKYPINWKKCTPIAPKIVVKFLVTSSYTFPTAGDDYILTRHNAQTSVEKNIVSNVQNYINEIQLKDSMSITNILNAVQSADISVNNVSTLIVQEGYINEEGTYTYQAPLTYYKYYDNSYAFEYGEASPNGFRQATLTING